MPLLQEFVTGIWDAIRQRRAVREYRPETVPEPLLRRLIDAGNWAPSAMNGQPWRFAIVTDAGLLARIADGHPTSRHAPSTGGDLDWT